jgi:ubiquitin C-terminal hydrolase
MKEIILISEKEETGDIIFMEPKKILYDRKNLLKMIADSHLKIGVGLENMGNTCFANSVLQCLTYSPLFFNLMKSMNIQSVDKKSKILDVVGFVINKIISNKSQFAPSEVIQRFQDIGSFKLGSQADCHEFLVRLIEKMEESIIGKNKYSI